MKPAFADIYMLTKITCEKLARNLQGTFQESSKDIPGIYQEALQKQFKVGAIVLGMFREYISFLGTKIKSRKTRSSPGTVPVSRLNQVSIPVSKERS